jgi:hypothetical protein
LPGRVLLVLVALTFLVRTGLGLKASRRIDTCATTLTQ